MCACVRVCVYCERNESQSNEENSKKCKKPNLPIIRYVKEIDNWKPMYMTNITYVCAIIYCVCWWDTIRMCMEGNVYVYGPCVVCVCVVTHSSNMSVERNKENSNSIDADVEDKNWTGKRSNERLVSMVKCCFCEVGFFFDFCLRSSCKSLRSLICPASILVCAVHRDWIDSQSHCARVLVC